MPAPKTTHLRQRICTECGAPFVTERFNKVTDTDACKKRRQRRRAAGDMREYSIDSGEMSLLLEQASSNAVDDLPAVAREVLADELRPHMREHLSGAVLEGIAGMVGLMPLFQAALADDLDARAPMLEDGKIVRDSDGSIVWVVDHERRGKAQALWAKYTLGQPGLAPQPEAPEAAPITIVFPSMPGPSEPIVDVEIDEIKAAELESGDKRLCDICTEVKPTSEFVGTSNRCADCHQKQRERVEAAIAARQPQQT